MLSEKYTANIDYRAKLYLNLSKKFHEIKMPDLAKFYIDKSLAVIQKENINLYANIYKTLSQIAEKHYRLIKKLMRLSMDSNLLIGVYFISI